MNYDEVAAVMSNFSIRKYTYKNYRIYLKKKREYKLFLTYFDF